MRVEDGIRVTSSPTGKVRYKFTIGVLLKKTSKLTTTYKIFE